MGRRKCQEAPAAYPRVAHELYQNQNYTALKLRDKVGEEIVNHGRELLGAAQILSDI